MIYTIENAFLSVSVEDAGAQLKSIFDKTAKTELLWQGNASFWKGRAYNLFPIVGRLYDGKYSYHGKIYEMDRHGFARGKRFCLCDKSSDAMTFAICSDDDTLKSYPFEFIFKVGFTLAGNKLKISYRVENVGEGDMYFGLGAHPGFNVPFNGGKFEDYEIRFNAPCSPQKELFGENYLMADKREPFELDENNSFPLKHSLFDNDAVVLRNAARSVTLKKKDDEKGITVDFPSMPFIGFWHTPKTEAPFLCIEPWENLPSKEGEIEDLTQKENIGFVKEGMSSECEITVTIG